MLMAVGMNKKRVFQMIMFETVLLSFTGAAAGMLLGLGLISWLGRQGINLAGVAGDSLAIYGYGNMIYPYLETPFYLQTAFLVLLIALLSALYPAFKALQLVPAEAVRKE
jgi:ABC-type antimicrobial peptide transport system permease subunit